MIGKLAVTTIEDYIKQLSTEERWAWLHWAKQLDGPLFWEVPSPQGSPVLLNAAGYQVKTIVCSGPFPS